MSNVKRSYAEYKASQLATPAEPIFSPNVESGEETDFTSYHSSDSEQARVELHSTVRNEFNDFSELSGDDTDNVLALPIFANKEPRGFYLDEEEEDIVGEEEEGEEDEEEVEEDEDEDEEEDEEDVEEYEEEKEKKEYDRVFEYDPFTRAGLHEATSPGSPLLRGKVGKQIQSTAKILNFFYKVNSFGVDSDNVDQIRESLPHWEEEWGETPEKMVNENLDSMVRYCMNMKVYQFCHSSRQFRKLKQRLDEGGIHLF